LLSSAEPEVRRLIVLARQWAERLAKPVRVWMSDKQDAFVKAIAEEFSGTPHRYCQNHFMRDLAKPVLEMESRAKVKMRRKVRGVRALERRVLEDRRQPAVPEPPPLHETPKTDAPPRANTPEAPAPAPCASSDLGLVRTDSAREATSLAAVGDPGVADEAGEVVLGDGAAVRGMLNDSRGGPLHPPGLRMSEA
jgi:hypothetical protein